MSKVPLVKGLGLLGVLMVIIAMNVIELFGESINVGASSMGG